MWVHNLVKEAALDLARSMAGGKDPFFFTLPDAPIPWARAKPSSRGMYDSQKHLKLITRAHIEKQLPVNFKMYKGPLLLLLFCFIELPKQKRGAHHNPLEPHFSIPDTSNLTKHIEDCGTKLLYQDDSLIFSTVASKFYDAIPRTEFALIEVKK